MSKLLKGAILPIVAGIVALVAATVLVILFMVHPETKVAAPSQAMQPRGEDRQAADLSPKQWSHFGISFKRRASAAPPSRMALCKARIATGR